MPTSSESDRRKTPPIGDTLAPAKSRVHVRTYLCVAGPIAAPVAHTMFASVSWPEKRKIYSTCIESKKLKLSNSLSLSLYLSLLPLLIATIFDKNRTYY